MKRYPLFAAVLLAGCSSRPLPDTALAVDELKITVDYPSREVGYTNKQSGFWYSETNAEHHSGWQGWNVFSRKMLDDYRIEVDGTLLRKSDAQRTEVFPHQLTRWYRDGISETVTLLDSIDVLVVELAGLHGRPVRISPLFDQSTNVADYRIVAESQALLTSLRRYLAAPEANGAPAWVGVATAGTSRTTIDTATFTEKRRFATGSIRLKDGSNGLTILFACGHTQEQSLALLRQVAADPARFIASRKARMQRLLDDAPFRTTDVRFDRAMAWATISMDALLMNQVRKGIFAGLPWFNNYWGRDSFISLPGATLVTGRFPEAMEILKSFADWQETNPSSPNEGRIPNLVTTTSISYNTADGTPWFVIALQQYVAASGDTAFGRRLYPVVKRSVEGTLRHHVDRYGFLVHGDAETWMDAVGQDGPWSPRGDRACDIQALWVRQLLAASSFARTFGDEASVDRWETVVDTVIQNFQRFFIDRQQHVVYDHLLPDGTPDGKLRPNQLFATDIIQDPAVRASLFRAVTQQVVYSFGVGSLSPRDPDFHPFHHYEPQYVQDAAYHQGIVWTWLNGRWIQTATGFGLPDLAYAVTDNMVHQILDRGAVGTLSELLDAAPRPAELEPRLSGTFSQAWSLAEFIRNAYQSYAGITVDVPGRHVWLYPQLPRTLGRVRCGIPFGSERIGLQLAGTPDQGTVVLNTSGCKDTVDFTVGWSFGNRKGRVCTFALPPGREVTLDITEGGYELTGTGGEPVPVETMVNPLRSSGDLDHLKLAAPFIPESLNALRAPKHRLLSHAEIKASDSGAPVISDREDPAGDDRGTGTYRYPQNPNFRPGCLDLTRFRLAADERNVYFRLIFRDLSDPGWHPEYGFQLTFAAICIHTDGPASVRREVGRNSGYVLPPSAAAEYVVYVGGGVRVEDSSGTLLAEYRPIAGDETDPLGSTADHAISFALPRSLFASAPASWKTTLLIGAQDDHGGAGIGDFRSVDAAGGEWTGGGKMDPKDSNVYDVLNP